MLTKDQIAAASKLFQDRPAVLPGTRAILSETQASLWHTRVMAEMQRTGITTQAATAAFCDLAGVAD